MYFFHNISFITLSISATEFPETSIKTKYATSEHATSKNAFYVSNTSLKGQCTWYAYGRVIELAESGHLNNSVKKLFINAFWGKTGRHARYWPDSNFLGGTWFDTNQKVLPISMRKKGLLAVWKFGNYGHVGFVEEVSADKSKYRLSDFNRSLNESYQSKWYNFVGTSDRLGGVYPHFLELESGNGNPPAQNKARFISETIEDNSIITGEKTFTKTWTIQNTGNTTWNSNYKLKYVNHQNGRLCISTSPIKISGLVHTRDKYTFRLEMKAPPAKSSEKTYREDWKFVDPSGNTIN